MEDRTPEQKQEAQEGLTGFWTGVFDTADLSFDATPFHAFLHEEAGLTTGESVEPNGFSPDPITELFSSLEGWRDGAEIEFVKTYESALGAGFSVRFEGALGACGRRIQGVWTMLGAAPRAAGVAVTGPFVMNRVSGAAEKRLDLRAGRWDEY